VELVSPDTSMNGVSPQTDEGCLVRKNMSSRRKKRRAAERRLAKMSKRGGLGIAAVVIIVSVAIAVGLSRVLR